MLPSCCADAGVGLAPSETCSLSLIRPEVRRMLLALLVPPSQSMYENKKYDGYTLGDRCPPIAPRGGAASHLPSRHVALMSPTSPSSSE